MSSAKLDETQESFDYTKSNMKTSSKFNDLDPMRERNVKKRNADADNKQYKDEMKKTRYEMFKVKLNYLEPDNIDFDQLIQDNDPVIVSRIKTLS